MNRMVYRAQLRATLLEMRERGPVTPSAYVKEVEPADHPLHETLEWDDSVAGHQYRLQQARRLIVLVRDVDETTKQSVPLFIHVPSPKGEGEYELGRVLVTQPDRLDAARQQVLQQLDAANENLDDLNAIVERYGRATPKSRRRIEVAHRHIDRAREAIVNV